MSWHEKVETKSCAINTQIDETYSSNPKVPQQPESINMFHSKEIHSTFSCHICNKTFPQERNLKYHLKCHFEEKPFACHLCDKKFSAKSNLTMHAQTHSKDRPFGLDEYVSSI